MRVFPLACPLAAAVLLGSVLLGPGRLPSVQAAPEGEAGSGATLSDGLTRKVEAALRVSLAAPPVASGSGASRLGASSFGASRFVPLYRAAVMEHGQITPVLAYLGAIRADKSVSAERRRRATGVEAYLLRRAGRLADALARFQELDDGPEGLTARLEQARLLDMLGKSKQAWQLWKRLLPQLEAATESLGAERVRNQTVEVRLRMALLGREAGGSVKQALAEMAREQGVDPRLRNRAAIVLALRGHPKEALALFVPSGAGTQRFRQQIRLADWALAAGEPARAQGFAWAAQEAAALKRDRRYAFAVLVEAHRETKDLGKLIDRLAGTPDLSAAGREVWIDLLRETGRLDEALGLFRAAADGTFTVAMRRELLEMCRESGDEDSLLAAYREMIESEPAVTEWREGLSRHYLERGQTKAAQAVWDSYLRDPQWTKYLLAAAEALHGVGLDDLSARFAEASIERGEARSSALLFLFGLHKERGRFEAARKELDRFDALAAPDAAARMQLSEAYEQLGDKRRAVKILEDLSEARGPERSAEDMEMRLAWLHSEVGNEEEALTRWLSLWRRVQAVSRRRYVEDRLMTVAARLGKLADIAIELEEKLAAGTADARDSGLLTRLYTKAGDPISATEVIEEYMRGAGAAPVAMLVEKSRVFLACSDYNGYEETIRQLIETDPDGKADYLRQLAMSQLERGRPDEARAVLVDLGKVEDATDSAEFEAGVLALAGLREEAIRAYRRGLARSPDRIESLLLMGALMAQIGRKREAVGMLQHLAETAEKDDLFIIAIDGLLNLEAAPEVLRWARRITVERLAGRHDKVYLYQLIADLAEQTGSRDVMLRALQGSLPIIGERRSSMLRELMDHTRTKRSERAQHLAFGRRLIGLGEVAPPQVYLDLGRVFLDQGEISNAVKTFTLATDVPDYGSFQQEVATAFEAAGYAKQSLQTWQLLQLSRPNDAGILLKIGELQEQVGRDDVAVELYARALDVMIARRPLSTVLKDEQPSDLPFWFRSRNVDELDRFYERTLMGFLTTVEDTPATGLWLVRVRAALEEDLKRLRALLATGTKAIGASEGTGEGREEAQRKAEQSAKLAAWPRVRDRARLYRRATIALGRPELADDLDLTLLRALPDDESLLRSLVRDRLGWGLVTSARKLLEESGRGEEEVQKIRFLVEGSGAGSAGRVSLLEANRLFLPLVVEGDTEALRRLLRRLDFSTVSKEDQAFMPVLQSAALQMADGRLALALGRHWIRVLIKKDKRPDAPRRFRPVLKRIKGLLDEAEYRSLCEYVVQLILKDPKKAGYWLSLLPEMQQDFEQALLDEEQRKTLVENIDGTRWYWIGSLFPLLPEAQRGALLRTALPKVPNTQRVSFLLRLVDEIKDPIEGTFQELLLDAFDTALEDVDKAPPYMWYAFVGLARGVTHLDTRIEMLDRALAKKPGKPLVRAARAVLLKRMDKRAEGLEEALAVLPELSGNKVDFRLRAARNAIFDAFLPDDLETFQAALDTQIGAGPPSESQTELRIDLARRVRKPKVLLAAYRQAVAAHPKNKRYASLVRGQLSSLGYSIEALGLVRAEAEKNPDDESLQKQLVSAWRRVGNPVRALALKQALRAKRLAKADGDAPKKRSPWVSPRDIKAALDTGDEEEAAILARRLWRRFQAGAPGGRNFIFYPNQRAALWPADRKDDDEEPDVRRLRGGLTAFEASDVDPPPPRTLYEALAAYDFGTREMERELRTWDGARLSGGGELVDGLARGLARKRGTAETVRSLLREAQGGRAGKRTYGLLLSLFAEAPDEVLTDARPILVDLERTLDPTDVAQLRRLARVWARLGDEPRAARIYRWCGTRASAGQNFFFRVGSAQPVPTGALVKEVGEVLTGDLRVATIEAILAFGAPGRDIRFGPFAVDAHDALVLQTWTDLLEPAAALEKCRPILDRLAAGFRMPQRRTSMLAAALLAETGDVEGALQALENAVCKLEPSAGTPAHQMIWFERSGRINRGDVRRLLPADLSTWAHGKAWAQALVGGIPSWVKSGRTEAAGMFEAFAVALVRLAGLGDLETAAAALPTLEAMGGDRAYHQLWMADVARRLGAIERADAIERALFDDRRLTTYRVPEVVARMRESEGAEAALVAGEKRARYLLHPVLIDELIATAEAARKPERVAYWKKTKQQVEEARKILDELDAEE